LKSSAALSNVQAKNQVTAGKLPSPPSNPQPPSSGKCPKRGLAYTFPAAADMSAASSKLTWWYNWGANPTSAETNHGNLGLEFVPMIWGQNFLNSIVPSNSKYILGFNEPNFHSQSNLDAAHAASLWGSVITDIKGANPGSNNYKTVSPAINYCGPASACQETDPFVWLDKFFAACNGCEVDHIAAHWYGCTADALKSYLTNLKKYNKKIWITEFACAPWDGSYQNNVDFQIQYMKDAVTILENDPMVYRYAWFTGRASDMPNGNVFSGTGQLTDLGNQYMNQPCGSSVAAAIADSTSQNAPENTQPVSTVSPLVIGLSVGGAVLFIVIVAVIIVVARKGKIVEAV